MTASRTLAGCAALVALVACGGRGSGPDTTPAAEPAAGDTTPPGDDGTAQQPAADAETDRAVDYQEVELPSASNFLPLLKVGAEGIGCALVAEQPDGLAYQCKEGLIFMVQKGGKLRYACENTPDDQCGALMTRITDKMLQAAGR